MPKVKMINNIQVNGEFMHELITKHNIICELFDEETDPSKKRCKLDEIRDSLDKISRLHFNYSDETFNYDDLIEINYDSFDEIINYCKHQIIMLDFSNHKLKELPDSINKFTNLKELICDNNNLKSLPESIGDLTNLELLECSKNYLIELPESIYKLTNLKELICDNNYLKSLPESISKLINLKTLDCSSNHLSFLPESIGDLINLKVLYCYYNYLRFLPNSIGNLINLEKLNCVDNRIKELPESIGNLINLKELFCSDNQIKELPETIINLKNIDIFDTNKLTLTPPQDRYFKWVKSKKSYEFDEHVDMTLVKCAHFGV